jgi:hypothetical protein
MTPLLLQQQNQCRENPSCNVVYHSPAPMLQYKLDSVPSTAWSAACYDNIQAAAITLAGPACC